ncbi:PIR Superfamily Protein, partial [Plasmodium ovale curtisi]
ENTLDSWKKWKDLYDFIKNYNEIQNKIKSNDISCLKYLEYYQYIEGIYNVYKQDCSQDGLSYSVAASLPERDQDEPGDMINNSYYYYTKLGVSLPFIGIISSFVYLYNFTTFGTCIISKLMRKNKINLNLDDDTQHLLQHDSENIDLNTYNDDFNINYHSS